MSRRTRRRRRLHREETERSMLVVLDTENVKGIRCRPILRLPRWKRRHRLIPLWHPFENRREAITVPSLRFVRRHKNDRDENKDEINLLLPRKKVTGPPSKTIRITTISLSDAESRRKFLQICTTSSEPYHKYVS